MLSADEAMDGDQLIEWIKLVGSLVGLLTGAFTVWDRWARGRPVASLDVISLTGGNHFKCVHIRNVGEVNLLIINIKVWPKGFVVAKNNKIRGIAEALYGRPTVAVLRAGEERDFPFIERPAAGKTKGRIVVWISWRKTSTAVPQFPYIICSSTEVLAKMVKAHES